MKKWIFILALIIFLIFAGVFYLKKTTLKLQPPPNVLSETDIFPSPSIWPQSTVIEVDKIPIRISWALVKPEEVELYSNLKEQQLSEQIKVDKSCRVLVNGGFYSKENTHLGLFVSNSEAVSQPIQSALLNGFLLIDSTDNIKISADSPDITPRLGLQTGPLLMQRSQPLLLAINNDEPARRIVAGITSNNELVFLALYKEKSELEGPLLGQLPQIINLFKNQTNINITDAVNLDGGSASVFIANYDLLRELTYIGSYFCIK